jgi:hypothetical protein
MMQHGWVHQALMIHSLICFSALHLAVQKQHLKRQERVLSIPSVRIALASAVACTLCLRMPHQPPHLAKRPRDNQLNILELAFLHMQNFLCEHAPFQVILKLLLQLQHRGTPLQVAHQITHACEHMQRSGCEILIAVARHCCQCAFRFTWDHYSNATMHALDCLAHALNIQLCLIQWSLR